MINPSEQTSKRSSIESPSFLEPRNLLGLSGKGGKSSVSRKGNNLIHSLYQKQSSEGSDGKLNKTKGMWRTNRPHKNEDLTLNDVYKNQFLPAKKR